MHCKRDPSDDTSLDQAGHDRCGLFFIQRDVTVFVNLWTIHHDIEYWVKPFTFQPERFLNEDRQLRFDGMLPFSAGIRTCPREKFGKKVVFLFVARLFHRFKFECQEGKEIPAEEDSDFGILRNCKPFKICAVTKN